MKVVWICPLEISKFKYFERSNIAKTRPTPWIDSLITEFEKITDIELFVISTSRYIKKSVEFSEKNINYYVLEKDRQVLPTNKEIRDKYTGIKYQLFKLFIVPLKYTQHIYQYLDLALNYPVLSFKVKHIINTIKPDIVHSYGTEYIWSAPLFKINYPKLITIQGFISSDASFKKSLDMKLRRKLEFRAFKKNDNFVIRAKFMEDIILTHNIKAKFWYISFITEQGSFKKITTANYDADIVFAARIKKEKGIEDLLNACVFVKKEIPSFRLKIIGLCSNDYELFLKEMIQNMGIEENVCFIGYIENRELVYQEIKKSKILVLPSYHDVTPGSITEAIFLDVAVIAYNVGGIPGMISNGHSGYLLEKHDILGLSSSILKLLRNEAMRLRFIKNAKDDAKSAFLFNNSIVIPSMINCYKEVIRKYNNV